MHNIISLVCLFHALEQHHVSYSLPLHKEMLQVEVKCNMRLEEVTERLTLGGVDEGLEGDKARGWEPCLSH